MKRTTKQGREIIAEVKSFLVTLNYDVIAGKLNRRGNESKVFANVVPVKTLKAGDKVCLRLGIKKFNGNCLVYAHSFGWIEVENMEEAFTSKAKSYDSLFHIDYSKLSNEDKIRLLKSNFPGKFETLTKSETLLMAYYNNQNLKEVEDTIHCDKSLKYKIKNHTDVYAEKMLSKLELELELA